MTELNETELLWLEAVDDEKALSFAKAHNARSEQELQGTPGFDALRKRLFEIYTAKDRLPQVTQYGRSLYNFWTDGEHPRGIWRRTSWSEYRKPQPKWEVLLDVDALNRAEGKSWVWAGADCLYPDYQRCLVQLSEAGGDAVEVREFDLSTKRFVEGGFMLPLAKTFVSWKDLNTLYVQTDFGPETMTRAGYARQVREWRRGTPLAAAPVLFEVLPSDVLASGGREFHATQTHDVLARVIDFQNTEVFLLRDGKQVPIEKPSDATASLWNDQLLLQLRSPWAVNGQEYPAGALLVTPLEPYLKGARSFQVLFTPDAHTSLSSWVGTKSRILTVTLEDVKSKVHAFSQAGGGKWQRKALSVDSPGTLVVVPVDPIKSDDAWLYKTDFLSPSSVSVWNVATDATELLRQAPKRFDASGLVATQHFATSKDGTRVPYYEISRGAVTQPSPTLLTAYGGFEVSLLPRYDPSVGVAWLERGGVFVQANLRGGGEYGPRWHQAAIKGSRQRAYEDFVAVAESLIARGVTTAKQLGIEGGSNGGLLTAVMLTQRPDLFGAVVSQVPLTDMRRYSKLLAGASWMSEYGDPDDAEDWKAIRAYSPLHNAKPAREVRYPPVFFTSSTRDDRVHPAHARKMVARLEALGHAPLYYENIEGGHGGAADAKQAAHRSALVFSFLARTLGLEGSPSPASSP